MDYGIEKHMPAGCRPHARLWIGGQWVEAQGGKRMDTINPSTGRPLYAMAHGEAADVSQAVAAARVAAPGWGAMDGIERGRILRRVADLIRSRAADFAVLDTLDAGRPIRDTGVRSAGGAARLFDFFAGLSDKLRGAVQPVAQGYSSQIDFEPFGVVGAITPWNYPLSNAATKIAPALACGNALVLKPAEQASLSALLLADLLHESGLPAGALNVVTGNGSEAGAALVQHPDVPKLAFTGSTATGRAIASHAGALLKSVTLELGGKSANIVYGDADIELAAKAAVFTAFNNGGQTCTAGTRLLAHHSIRERLIEAIRGETAKLSLGDPMREETQLGPLVSLEQHDRVKRYVDMVGPSGGWTELPPLGRNEPVPGGFFQPPVIVHDADREHPVVREEIFGPVLSVMGFDTDDEAVSLANDTQYGLAAAAWTTDNRRIERLKRELEAGLVWVNCVHALHPGVPVSGHKSSGVGSEFGLEAVHQYMKLKSTITAWNGWTSPFDT